MRYFYDCEFLENGTTIDLISIGIVAEDGREYYAVNSNFNYNKLERNDWMMQNVVPSLPLRRPPVQHGPNNWTFALDDMDDTVKSNIRIADEVQAFITEPDRKDVELWGYYSAYDHVVLCQLFGTMMDLPPNVPMYTRDIKQWCDQLGNPKLPEQGKGEHNALADAQWNRCAWEFLHTNLAWLQTR